jgi:hypothetical protein
MTLPDWSRPGEGRARSIALVLAIALPVIIHAAVGWQAWDGTTFLLLALPVLLVSWLGGLVAGLLATAVALAIPLARMMGGAPVDLVAAAALAALGVFAAVAFECWLRIHRSSSAERDEVTRRDAFHAAALETAADLAWSGRLDGERLVIETATPGFSHSLGVPFEEMNRRGGLHRAAGRRRCGSTGGELPQAGGRAVRQRRIALAERRPHQALPIRHAGDRPRRRRRSRRVRNDARNHRAP